jgi:hypothetical protein
MGTFILRFTGPGTRPAAAVARIRALRGLAVLDDSPRMLLVEAPEHDLRALMASLPDWVMTRERIVPLPDPRPRHRPDGGEQGARDS